MKFKERIYCIEGIHDWGKREIEPSIEPMLQILRDGVGLWDYVRRDCATEAELKWYIQEEWWRRCKRGSILYFSSHGSRSLVNLSDNENLTLGQLGHLLESDEEGGAENCFVHFGGCETFKDESAVQKFMIQTRAWACSGYSGKPAWYGVEENGVALEYMLLSSLGTQSCTEIEVGNNRHKKRLSKLGEEIKALFPKLNFKILISD